MKKFLILGLVVLASFLFVNNSFAGVGYPWEYTDTNGVKLFMTDSTSSPTPQQYFTLNEQPYLYLLFPDGSTGGTDFTTYNKDIFSFWHDPDGKLKSTPYNIVKGGDGINGIFLTPTDWGIIYKEGWWDIDTEYFTFKPGAAVTSGPIDDTGKPIQLHMQVGSVTPEPISALLFLVGGGAIAGFVRLRKKNI